MFCVQARDFVVLITNSPELQGYAGRALFRAAFDFDQQSNHFQLSAVAAWVLGEYGDVVVDQTTRLQGEVNTVVSEEDVVKLLESILGDIHAPSAVKQTAITALAKLGCRFKTQTRAVRGAMDKAGTSANVELQQRASEFCRIFDAGPALAAPLLERLPPFVMKSKEALHGVAGRGVHTGTAPAAAGAGGGAGDLLGDLMGMDDPAPGATSTGNSAVDLLGDLMAGVRRDTFIGGGGRVGRSARGPHGRLVDAAGGRFIRLGRSFRCDGLINWRRGGARAGGPPRGSHGYGRAGSHVGVHSGGVRGPSQ